MATADKKTTKRKVDEVDQVIGKHIRSRRLALGMTLEQLADALGISPQQLHNYESGTSAVLGRRLAKIATKLKTTTGYFFDDDPQSIVINRADESRLLRAYNLLNGNRRLAALHFFETLTTGCSGEAKV